MSRMTEIMKIEKNVPTLYRKIDFIDELFLTLLKT